MRAGTGATQGVLGDARASGDRTSAVAWPMAARVCQKYCVRRARYAAPDGTFAPLATHGQTLEGAGGVFRARTPAQRACHQGPCVSPGKGDTKRHV